MPEIIRLAYSHTDSYASRLVGSRVDWRHYDHQIGGHDADVYKPDGSPLLKFRAGVIPREVALAAVPALRKAAKPTTNRGTAAGGRHHKVKRNGRLSRATYTDPVLSGYAGFADREARHPFCRTTKYTREDPIGWATMLPMIRAADAVFKEEMPDRYEAQMRAVRQTPKDWVIPGTAFTTVTVNRNYSTTVHVDDGDLPEGFGVLTAIDLGEYEGGVLVFPKFRVGVDLRVGDVLLCDVHEHHGNTAIVGEPGWERLSVVLYYRKNMRFCKPRGEELLWAQRRRPGQPLNG